MARDLRAWFAPPACPSSDLDQRKWKKNDTIGAVWQRHDNRLHLHTDRGHSALPGLPMAATYSRYSSRAQVLDDLQSDAAHFALHPVFGSAVQLVRRAGTKWRVDFGQRTLTAPVVVVTTGWADSPYVPSWPESNDYQGVVVHASQYRNPMPYVRKRVLVVGLGISGGESAWRSVP